MPSAFVWDGLRAVAADRVESELVACLMSFLHAPAHRRAESAFLYSYIIGVRSIFGVSFFWWRFLLEPWRDR